MKHLLSCLILLIAISVQSQKLLSTREEAVGIVADLRKIRTPEGVEISEQIELNGEKQWVTIRGRNVANPILIFIHGGPANAVMPMSWAFQGPCEDYFTVVQWDQRAAGKNWLTTDTTKLSSTIQIPTYVNDGIALVDHLTKRYNKQKVFIMGYSWGTIIGTKMAAAIPEKLYAYIGVGQSSVGAERFLYDRLIQLAEREKNETALKEIKSIFPYPNPEGDTPIQKVFVSRKWARYYDGAWFGEKNFGPYDKTSQLSPDYSKAELEAGSGSAFWSTKKLIGGMLKNENPLEFKVPVFFMQGRYDLHTPYAKAKEYFDKIKAPKKSFITFERSAHVPFMEEPGRFFVTLVNEILPLAGKAPVFAPDLK